MLELLSLFKKMTSFNFTGINILYFQSNEIMKKVLNDFHGNHCKKSDIDFQTYNNIICYIFDLT